MLHHPILYNDVMLTLFLGGVSLYSSGITFLTLIQIHGIWKLTQTVWYLQEYLGKRSLYNHLINEVLDTMCVSYYYSLFYGIGIFVYLFFHWCVWGIDNNIIYIPMINMNYFVFHKRGSQYIFSFKNPIVIWNPSMIMLGRDPAISEERLCGDCSQEEDEDLPHAEAEIAPENGSGEEKRE